MMNRPPALVLGIPIADVTMSEVVDLIGEFVAVGRREQRTFQVATVNVDFLVNALTDAEVRRILQRAEVCLADGMPLVWGSALLGTPIRERVAGADLVPMLFEMAASTGWRIHVLGSSPDVAARAGDLLGRLHPNARLSIDAEAIVADPTNVDPSVLDSILQVDPDILFVALGNPKQELFIDAYRQQLGVPVMIGIGGSLDMLVGARRRAPIWIQRIGMEWVVRAAQEPRRLGRRYAHDIRIFGPSLYREWRSQRRRRHGQELTITATAQALLLARVSDHPPAHEPLSWASAADLIDAGSELSIEFDHPGAMTNAAASQLVGLIRLARLRGSPVRWPTDIADLARTLGEVAITPAELGHQDTGGHDS